MPGLNEIESWSLKRLAWAYGCAKSGSDEEALLHTALTQRLGGGKVHDLELIIKMANLIDESRKLREGIRDVMVLLEG